MSPNKQLSNDAPSTAGLNKAKPSPWKVTGSALLFFVLAVASGMLSPIMSICYWIAPAFTLMFLDRLSRRMGFLIFFVSTIPLFVFQTRGIIPLPDEQLYVMAVMVGLIGFIPYWMQLVVKERLPRILVPLVFPAANVVLEFVGSTGPFGSWGSIAYTQFGNQTVMQLASLFGVWGITFFVSWAASLLWFTLSCLQGHASFEKTGLRSRSKNCCGFSPELVVFLLVTIAVIGFGQARLSGLMSSKVESNQAFQVACVSAPGGTSPSDSVDVWIDATRSGSVEPEQLEELLEASKASVFEQLDYLLKKSGEQANAGAKLIVWSEAALITPPDFEEDVLNRCQEFANSNKANLALTLGVFRDTDDEQFFENKTVVINDSGVLAGEYFKTKIVPGEPSIPGDGTIPVFETRGAGRISPIVCFDADFPDYVRQIASVPELAPTVLVVSANDWEAVADSHLHMSVFRAIENGVWVVRATSNGKSAVISPLGEVLSQGSSFETDEPSISGWVSGGTMRTLYPRIGDAFAWFSCLLLAFLMVLAIARGKRTS